MISDERSQQGIKKAKKLEDEDRERKWEEEHGEEYANAIMENGKYWDQWEKENLNLTSNDCE